MASKNSKKMNNRQNNDKYDNSNVSKSWFCVFNNPQDHGLTGTPEEIANQIRDNWIEGNPTRTCGVAYCIAVDGMHHAHALLEDTKAMRFTAIRNELQARYPGMHIEGTKGSKKDAEDYLYKRGKYEKKGEQVLYITVHGEIKGKQGNRSDLGVIESLLDMGLTPKEVMRETISYRRYEKIIKDEYFDRRYQETPIIRDVKVYFHVGESGTGKTYAHKKLVEKHGEKQVFRCDEYKNGLDKYDGEKFLFLDEYRAQWPYSRLMTILDAYKSQVPCRYTNTYGLWTEVHIASVLPPETIYALSVQDYKSADTYAQLKRRISYVVFHFKRNEKEYLTYVEPMGEYVDYATLKARAEAVQKGFDEMGQPEQLTFE